MIGGVHTARPSKSWAQLAFHYIKTAYLLTRVFCRAALAGLDLEMPGPSRFRGDVLKFNAQTDKVREHIIDERAKTVLEFVKKCYESGIEENAPEKTLDTPETAAMLRKIGNEGLVLLKNEHNLLPFKKDKKVQVSDTHCTFSMLSAVL